MPGFDGTGPRGLGPMTGGGRGFCNPNFAGKGGSNMGNPYARHYRRGAPYGGYPYGDYPYAPYQAFPYGGFGMGRGMGRGFGRGFGMGRGMGRGRRFWLQMPFTPGAGMQPFGFPMSPEEKVQFLKDHAQMLKEELNQIDTRTSELERAN